MIRHSGMGKWEDLYGKIRKAEIKAFIYYAVSYGEDRRGSCGDDE